MFNVEVMALIQIIGEILESEEQYLEGESQSVADCPSDSEGISL